MRNRKHPLSDRGARRDVVDKVGREIAHASADTARTESAALAGQRDDTVRTAAIARDANEAVRQNATLEKCLDFLDHETRQGRSRVVVADFSEESPPMRLKGLIEDGLLRTVALVATAAGF